MKYLALDIITLILAILGFAYFYGDLISGNFNTLALIYFVILAIGYFGAIHMLHIGTKRLIEKLAEDMNCQFIDSGKYALSHRIKCKDMIIEFNLRGSYTPASIHISMFGNFHEADIRGGDKKSRKFAEKLQRLQKKWRVRVNDAYVSEEKAEAIITKFPYDEEKLKGIIEEFRQIVIRV